MNTPLVPSQQQRNEPACEVQSDCVEYRVSDSFTKREFNANSSFPRRQTGSSDQSHEPVAKGVRSGRSRCAAQVLHFQRSTETEVWVQHQLQRFENCPPKSFLQPPGVTPRAV